MGITGLIPFLEKASSKLNLRDIKGSTVAIDTYCWLHKGAFGCAEKLSRGEDTDLYIQYCLKYVNLLLEYDIKPILIFDGRHLPAKALTEKRRRESRDQSKKKAAALLRAGKIQEARSHMRRCVDITHEMALRLIKECRKRNVDCIVAPYEADAQMAYLNKLNVAQYIITEDSDLVLFGSQKIIFKLDLTGNGLLVEADKLHLAMGCREDKYTFDKFRTMCILSGCDYLDSLPGIGLAKACKFVLKTEETNIQRALLKIPQYLNLRNIEVTDEYIDGFLKAEATFKHMFVYDPFKREMVRLNSLDEMPTKIEYCSNAGTLLESDVAFQLALGNINPFSLKVLDNWNPDSFTLPNNGGWGYKVAKHKSVWQSNFAPHVAKAKSEKDLCAILFKKVQYKAPVEVEEIREESPPPENEIVSLYRDEEPSPTRPRTPSSPHQSPPTPEAQSPTAESSRKKHNPFAKSMPQKSAKADEDSPFGKFQKLTNVKRCLIDQTTTQEVKSRFFASNVSLVTSLDETRLKRKSVDSKEDEEAPLAKRGLFESDEVESKLDTSLDSGIEACLSAKNSNSSELECSVGESSKPDKEMDVDVILISDSENSFQMKPAAIPAKPPISKHMLPKQKVRSVGLSKPKAGNAKKAVPEGQTKLSMFGFQKRPLLK